MATTTVTTVAKQQNQQTTASYLHTGNGLKHHNNDATTRSRDLLVRRLVVLFAVLVVAGEGFIWLPVDLTLQFFSVIVPTLLAPIWFRYRWDTFLWCKTLSLIPFAVYWVSLVRLGDVLDEQWIRIGSFLVVSCNIAEAVTKDAVNRHWGNVLVGIALILTEIPTMSTIRVEEHAPYSILWSLGPRWIIAYTVWNWIFARDNYPYSLGRHTAVLMAPLTLALVHGWDHWIEARGYTLSFYFVLRCTWYSTLRSMTDIEVDKKSEVARGPQGCTEPPHQS